MKFYQLLSRYYSLVFPLAEKTQKFLSDQYPPKRGRALDVGCGIGDTCNYLKDSFSCVYGIDLSDSMVADARKKRTDQTQFDVLDMRNLSMKFEASSFDLVTCMGNTLVHIQHEEVLHVLKQFKEILVQGGRFVIAILNYDRILEQKIEVLPIIESQDVIFERHYPINRMSEASLQFSSRIFDKETCEWVTSSTTLYPLRKEKLLQLCEEAKLCVDGVYGSFDPCAYSNDSYSLIVTGFRP